MMTTALRSSSAKALYVLALVGVLFLFVFLSGCPFSLRPGGRPGGGVLVGVLFLSVGVLFLSAFSLRPAVLALVGVLFLFVKS